MNEFTASNGFCIGVDRSNPNRIAVANAGGHLESVLTPDRMRALREFFQAETDERLGRWRDPEEPVFYVYSGGAWDGVFSPIRIVAETNGASWLLDREEHEPKVPPKVLAVARRYFDAHPEPKPWHDAKPGELWAIRIDDEDDEIGVSVETFEPGADVFQVPDGESISITRPSIVTGRRVWPEVSP